MEYPATIMIRRDQCNVLVNVTKYEVHVTDLFCLGSILVSFSPRTFPC